MLQPSVTLFVLHGNEGIAEWLGLLHPNNSRSELPLCCGRKLTDFYSLHARYKTHFDHIRASFLKDTFHNSNHYNRQSLFTPPIVDNFWIM